MAEDDGYTIPGSGGILRNKLGLTTAEAVDEALNLSASQAWSAMRREPIPDRLDVEFLRSIHRRFFSPVLEWAGEFRQAGDEVIAGGTGIIYARAEFFRNGLDDVFGQLAAEDYRTGLSADEFASRLADRRGYLSAVHPFRDGNTRSQSAYVDRLAERAGHPLNWTTIDVDRLRSLRLKAVAGSEIPLADYLRTRLVSAVDGSRGVFQPGTTPVLGSPDHPRS
jgi:cell filamentation protein